MYAILEVTFEAQAFQAFTLAYCADNSIFFDDTVVFPSDSLDVRFRLDFRAKWIDFESF